MTKEITKAYILQQIQDKFKLRDYEAEKFLFSELVVPTYDISPHLLNWVNAFAEVSITSAAGFLFFTVPQNERWEMDAYNVIFMGAGALEVTGVYIVRGPEMRNLYLDMTAGQTVSYSVVLPQPITLESGDTISILVDTYVSTQALRLYIGVKKEEIR